MKPTRPRLLLPLALCLMACGEETPLFQAQTPAPAPQTPAPAPETPSPQTMTDPGQTPCADEARWVYLVGLHRELIRFEPDTLTFTTISTLTCAGDPQIHNIAVERSSRLWVIDQLGNLSHVDPITGACDETSFSVSQNEFEFVGMAFSDEQLFVAGAQSQLGTIGTSDLSLNIHSRVLPGPLSLTSNGSGELWALSNREVLRLDASSGATLENHPVEHSGAFQSAFVAWGGAFYFFLPLSSTTSGPGSTVWRWTPGQGPAVQVASTDARIVGAGASTCAPTEGS